MMAGHNISNPMVGVLTSTVCRPTVADECISKLISWFYHHIKSDAKSLESKGFPTSFSLLEHQRACCGQPKIVMHSNIRACRVPSLLPPGSSSFNSLVFFGVWLYFPLSCFLCRRWIPSYAHWWPQNSSEQLYSLEKQQGTAIASLETRWNVWAVMMVSIVVNYAKSKTLCSSVVMKRCSLNAGWESCLHGCVGRLAVSIINLMRITLLRLCSLTVCVWSIVRNTGSPIMNSNYGCVRIADWPR